MIVRSGGSGARLRPLAGKGQVAWDMVSPLVLELAPIGHAAGMYEIIQTAQTIVGATSGSLSTTLAWDQPRFGATTLVLNLGNVTAGTFPGALRAIDSSGLAAITLTLSGTAIVGSPSLAVACAALFKALPVT